MNEVDTGLLFALVVFAALAAGVAYFWKNRKK